MERPHTSCFASTVLRHYWALLKRQIAMFSIWTFLLHRGVWKVYRSGSSIKWNCLYFKVEFFFLWRMIFFCHCFVVLVDSKNSWWTLQVIFSEGDRAVMLALHCSVINGLSSLGRIPLFQVLQTTESQSSITTEMFVHLVPHSLWLWKISLLESTQQCNWLWSSCHRGFAIRNHISFPFKLVQGNKSLLTFKIHTIKYLFKKPTHTIWSLANN